MRYDYSPFAEDFDDIIPESLTVLSSVAEGWYVEYKREVPNANAIAKSITAFANTYGGWLFCGIAEKSKEDAVAGAFPGIANEEADGFLQRIRQAVANHSQPTPYFRAKALFGPVESLGLPEGRCVIIGQIPWGPEAPYIHKDGRIYRRVGDGSEPRPENDRFVLDQLWRRSSKITKEYADWIGRELETSQAEKNAAYVRLFLISDFWGDHKPMKNLSLRKVRSIMSGVSGGYSIPFDNVYETSGGFICRQTANNDPEMLGFTWRLGRKFQSEIIIPLSKFNHTNLGNLSTWLHGYDHANRFLQLCHKQGYSQPTVIDLNILLHVLLGVARTQVALAKEFSWNGPIFVKMEISGVWRTIPFFDTPHVLDEYEQHGMVLALRNKIAIHPGKEQGSFIELLGSKDAENDEGHGVMIAVRLFIAIAVALGVSPGFDLEGDGSDLGRPIADFIDAGLRAIEVQKNRSKPT